MAKRRPSLINLLFAVDKPVGMTSHDAVARCRRGLGERRVGHAGTLDPLASGVLVLGVGQATRLLGRLTLDRKCYLARIAFGAETNTDDAEGEVVREVPPAEGLLDSGFAQELLSSFVGPQMQVPPAFSAISVNGVRSYARARSGEDVELPARPIVVHSARLISIDSESGRPTWTVFFEVSKGTYIRSLARDLGRAAESAAHISELRRTASGSISLGSCLALDDVSAHAVAQSALDPVRALGFPAYELSDSALEDVSFGRPLRAGSLGSPAIEAGSCDEDAGRAIPASDRALPCCLVHGTELRALAVVDESSGTVRMTDVFPQGIGGVRR